jgi:hypothetical protein
LEIRDDIVLVAVHPTGDRNQEQGERIHRQIIPGLKSDGQHNHWGGDRSDHAQLGIGRGGKKT